MASGAHNAGDRSVPGPKDTFVLPQELVRSLAGHGTPGCGRDRWMAALPGIVDELTTRWSLRVGPPFQPGGVCSWVAPAQDAAGQRLVLKVGWRHDEGLHEGEGLQAWNGRGAVHLLRSLAFEETNALLLEACEPGTTLSAALPPTEQDVVAAGLLRRLWITPRAGHPFRPLQDMAEGWADEFEEKYAAAPAHLRIDHGLARAGASLFRALPGRATASVLLCTDLHPDNILAARREPWLMIDPKPYVGDPAYDPTQHMFNFPDRLVADALGFVGRMAALVDLDAEHLRLWMFARCVQESIDHPELHPAASQLAP